MERECRLRAKSHKHCVFSTTTLRRRRMHSHVYGSATAPTSLWAGRARTHAPTLRLVGDKRASHALFFLRSEFYTFSFIYFSALCTFSSMFSIVFFPFHILFYGYWILMHISHIYFIYFMTKYYSSHPLFHYTFNSMRTDALHSIIMICLCMKVAIYLHKKSVSSSIGWTIVNKYFWKNTKLTQSISNWYRIIRCFNLYVFSHTHFVAVDMRQYVYMENGNGCNVVIQSYTTNAQGIFFSFKLRACMHLVQIFILHLPSWRCYVVGSVVWCESFQVCDPWIQ